jgi:hypothetical protein
MRLSERTKLVKKIKHKTLLLQVSQSQSCDVTVFVMFYFYICGYVSGFRIVCR